MEVLERHSVATNLLLRHSPPCSLTPPSSPKKKKKKVITEPKIQGPLVAVEGFGICERKREKETTRAGRDSARRTEKKNTRFSVIGLCQKEGKKKVKGVFGFVFAS